MKQIRMRHRNALNKIRPFRGYTSIFLMLLLLGCGKRQPEVPLPSHTLVFGGDCFFGTRTSQSLYTDRQKEKVFEDVAPLLKQADIAFVNAEGVIAGGGLPAEKIDRDPLYYRVHPNAASMLAEAGVDVVTIGNNHAGDYGPDAMAEMMDRLLTHGVQFTGGGYDAADAAAPPVFLVGDTGVAVVGVDLTFERKFAAGKDKPGTLYAGLTDEGWDMDGTVESLTAVLRHLRKEANVVLLSPHWGRNWQQAPTPEIRRLARRLIEAGYDGILGHSAHLVQGVELIDGKPIIYDTGNFLLSYGRPNDYDEHEALLYRIHFNKAGVTRLEARPIHADNVRTRLVDGEEGARVLERLKSRSEAFDTQVVIKGNKGIIRCDPEEISGPEKPTARLKAPPEKVRAAPSYLVMDALPSGATPASVQFENGIRLVGYRVTSKQLSHPRAGQFIETFWTTDRKQKADMLIHMEASGISDKNGEEERHLSGHQAGDWVFPITAWPVGKVIRDISYLRIRLKKESPIKFYTGLYHGRFIPILDADLPIENGRVFLGEAIQRKGGPDVFDVLERLHAALGV